MYIYKTVKVLRVSYVVLTGSWEKTLAQVERHTLDTETFMQSILDYTRRATEEILRLDFPAMQERAFTCPKCKTGKIILRSKVARCDHDGCGLLVFRRILNKELTDTHMEQLFSSGTTRLIKGFKGKKGVPFDAAVTFDAEYNTVFSFPKTGNGKKKYHRHSNSRAKVAHRLFPPARSGPPGFGENHPRAAPVFSFFYLACGGCTHTGP